MYYNVWLWISLGYVELFKLNNKDYDKNDGCLYFSIKWIGFYKIYCNGYIDLEFGLCLNILLLLILTLFLLCYSLFLIHYWHKNYMFSIS